MPEKKKPHHKDQYRAKDKDTEKKGESKKKAVKK